LSATRASLCAFLGLIAALCSVSAPGLVGHEALGSTVFFDREIVKILNRRCVMCHAKNSLAFPLETYEETFLRGRAIRAQVLARHMPPWAAVPGVGQFVNDNRLTLRETQFVIGWVESLGRRSPGGVFLNVADSDAAPRAVVRAEPRFDRWRHGEPDLTWQLDARTIEAGTAQTKRAVIDLGLTQERFVRGLEFKPGDRRILRAAFFSVEKTGQWLGSWTPWYGFVGLPAGVTYRLPAGTRVVADLRYQGISEPVVDRGTLGVLLSDRPGPSTPSDLLLEARSVGAAGSGPRKLTASTRVGQATYILSLRPDVQPGFTSIELVARKPDGQTEVLFFAKDFSVDWPTPYIFREPVLVPSGTEILVTAYSSAPSSATAPDRLPLVLSTFSK
jgi:hypothetical protein